MELREHAFEPTGVVFLIAAFPPKTVPSAKKGGLGGMFGMLKGLVGSKSLTREDMDSVLEKMKDHLIGTFCGGRRNDVPVSPTWVLCGGGCFDVAILRLVLGGGEDGLQVLNPPPLILDHVNKSSWLPLTNCLCQQR